MSESDDFERIQRQILTRIRVVKSRIVQLETEQVLLERMLQQHRTKGLKRRTPIRKGGFGKFLIQNQIVQKLEDAGVPISSRQLYKYLLTREPSLKATTYRSHLKRMVDSGIIEGKGQRGLYGLVESTSPASERVDIFG